MNFGEGRKSTFHELEVPLEGPSGLLLLVGFGFEVLCDEFGHDDPTVNSSLL